MHPADDSREDGHSATDTRSATKQSAVIFDDIFLGHKPLSIKEKTNEKNVNQRNSKRRVARCVSRWTTLIRLGH